MPVRAEAIEIVRGEVGAEEPFEAELLCPGCSGSQVVRVKTGTLSCVVRFWNMQWADYFAQDLACQVIASEASYGPRVFFVDEAKGITVMEYHRPEPWPEREGRLQRLATLLKSIHSGPEVPQGIDRAVYIDQLLQESSYENRDLLRQIKNEVFRVTRPNALRVPCHRDLHPGNLLYTQGQFLAIDYTWGAMDDPYADLANVAIFNCADAEEEEQLLKIYLGCDANERERARLSLMKLAASMFYGLEFLWLSAQGPLQEVTREPSSPKSYLNFGRQGVPTSQASFLDYGLSLLNEVEKYSISKQYALDVACLC